MSEMPISNRLPITSAAPAQNAERSPSSQQTEGQSRSARSLGRTYSEIDIVEQAAPGLGLPSLAEHLNVHAQALDAFQKSGVSEAKPSLAARCRAFVDGRRFGYGCAASLAMDKFERLLPMFEQMKDSLLEVDNFLLAAEAEGHQIERETSPDGKEQKVTFTLKQEVDGDPQTGTPSYSSDVHFERIRTGSSEKEGINHALDWHLSAKKELSSSESETTPDGAKESTSTQSESTNENGNLNLNLSYDPDKAQSAKGKAKRLSTRVGDILSQVEQDGLFSRRQGTPLEPVTTKTVVNDRSLG